MNKLFIKPRSGLKVPDPFGGGYLPEEGAEVAEHPYWQRQLRDKAVELVAASVFSAAEVQAMAAEQHLALCERQAQEAAAALEAAKLAVETAATELAAETAATELAAEKAEAQSSTESAAQSPEPKTSENPSSSETAPAQPQKPKSSKAAKESEVR